MSAWPDREVRDAIDRLVSENLWALDLHDLDAYLGTYWDDAVWIDTHPGEPDVRLTGVDEIRTGTAAYFTQPLGHQHRMQHAVYTEIDGGWAVTAYYWSSVRDSATGEVRVATTGWIRDVVEERAGAWRIRERTVGQWDGADPRP